MDGETRDFYEFRLSGFPTSSIGRPISGMSVSSIFDTNHHITNPLFKKNTTFHFYEVAPQMIYLNLNPEYYITFGLQFIPDKITVANMDGDGLLDILNKHSRS